MEQSENMIAEVMQRTGMDYAQLAERLGIKERTLRRINSGEFPLSLQLGKHLSMFLQNQEPNYGTSENLVISEESGSYSVPLRQIPVISWCHAGEAVSYEELPTEWQETVPTNCADRNAFALAVEGDSMQPNYQSGDIVILMPGTPPRNGCLVVAKFKNDGVVFRRFNLASGESVQLTAYNPIYPPYSGPGTDFHWIYPVHSTLKREWK